MEPPMKFHFKALPLVIALALTGCSQKSAEELIAGAEQQIASKQPASAIIDLKNALLEEPNNAKARFLLGKLYVERGAAAAGEKELSLALKQNYEPAATIPLLAKAYSLQFKSIEIIDLVNENKNLDPLTESSLLFYQALAFFQLDDKAKARFAIERANEISADSLFSQLGSAYLLFSDGQLEKSLTKINDVLDKKGDMPEAILLKAQLLTLNKDYPLAVKNFETYESLLPDLILGKILLANAYIKNEQYAEAEVYLDQLLKINKDQAFINQLKGLVRYQAKDFEKAKLFTEKAIQNGLASDANRIIAGISSFNLKNYEQAYQHLNSLQSKLPVEHPIHKLLAMVELKLGRNEDASDKLLNINGLGENDILLLSAASAQLLLSGDEKKAKELADKSKNIVLTDPLRLAQRGSLSLSMGDLEGINDLSKALEINPELEIANTALARAYIDGGFYQEAIDLANTWIEKKPNEVNGYVLAAIGFSKLNEIEQAEKMFTKALSIDNGNPAGNIYFADKAVKANNPKEAISALQKTIDSYPDYIPALKKYFVLENGNSNTSAGILPIEAAYNRHQNDSTYIMLYAQALFTAKQYSKTIELLEKSSIEGEKPDEYWTVFSNAYFYNSQQHKALLLANQWITEKPNEKAAYLRLIALHELYNENSDALEAVKRAKAVFINDQQFDILLTHFYLVTGNIVATKKSWDSLSVNIKESDLGQGLNGRILLEEGYPNEALPKLHIYYASSPSDTTAYFIAKALMLSNKFNAAVEFLQKHQQEHGESNINNMQLAELSINAGNENLAIATYRKILSSDSVNIRALNNLAYLLLKQQKYSEALTYAEKATEVSPTSPSILDTYATVLLKLGKAEDAVKNFDKAFNGRPTTVQSTLHYAESLILTGNKEKASTLLNGLVTKDTVLMGELERIKRLL
jgi:cellulose synthase operon protein C